MTWKDAGLVFIIASVEKKVGCEKIIKNRERNLGVYLHYSLKKGL